MVNKLLFLLSRILTAFLFFSCDQQGIDHEDSSEAAAVNVQCPKGPYPAEYTCKEDIPQDKNNVFPSQVTVSSTRNGTHTSKTIHESPLFTANHSSTVAGKSEYTISTEHSPGQSQTVVAPSGWQPQIQRVRPLASPPK